MRLEEEVAPKAMTPGWGTLPLSDIDLFLWTWAGHLTALCLRGSGSEMTVALTCLCKVFWDLEMSIKRLFIIYGHTL